MTIMRGKWDSIGSALFGGPAAGDRAGTETRWRRGRIRRLEGEITSLRQHGYPRTAEITRQGTLNRERATLARQGRERRGRPARTERTTR